MAKLKQLNKKHLKAIEKKWNGDGYQKISDDLGVSLDTVKSWFRASGLLKTHYETYAENLGREFLLNPTFHGKN